jgi:hypothetical protein
MESKTWVAVVFALLLLVHEQKEVYEKMRRVLLVPAEVDRAGAATLNLHNQLVARLKEVHVHHYVTQATNWGLWATRILASPSHQQEAMVHSAPPEDIIHLFAMAMEDPGVINQRILQSNAVARSENDRFQAGLTDLRCMLTEIERLIAFFNTRLGALETETSIRHNVLHEFASSLPPQETSFSARLFSSIGQQDDIDHE